MYLNEQRIAGHSPLESAIWGPNATIEIRCAAAQIRVRRERYAQALAQLTAQTRHARQFGLPRRERQQIAATRLRQQQQLIRLLHRR